MSISSKLQKGLQYLSMLDKDKPKYGLKFIDDINIEEEQYIKLHLYEAKKYNAKAVYFKYFDKRPPIPQIYIYEEDQNINTDSLHKELWSSCKVPMFFIFSTTDIKIFNSMSKKNIDKTENIEPLEVLQIAAQFQNDNQAHTNNFKASMFDSGEFWNTSLAKKEFEYKNSAYETLLDYLKWCRNELLTEKFLPKKVINSLLIKAILVRYLEERLVLNENYFNIFKNGAKNFQDICDNSNNSEKDNIALLEFFDKLTNKFNGGMFEINPEHREQIKTADLSKFSQFLKGDMSKNGQLHFWKLYSFKDLPIELISNIYELFLDDKNKEGVVYTPPLLVNFLIDEMMPLDKPKESFKVIDPSCGSGVFLVAAYKRLIQWHMLKNNMQKPSTEMLKKLIRDNIFGIDKEKDAVELAKFSLSLAICDTLSPELIFNDLHFDNLETTNNLITKDFFEIADNDSFGESFDLVIGNPPFMSKLNTSKAKELEKDYFKKHGFKLPNKQLAFLFLEQSLKLCKQNSHVCMIQPPAFLYANNVYNFRKKLFESYKVKQVLDFAGLNSSLFKRKDGGANVAVSVPIFQNSKPDVDKDRVLHVTVRETVSSKEKLYFDLSYYDFHWVTYRQVKENKYIWKCNLVGGSRTIDTIDRLSQFETLGKFLEDRKKDGFIYSEGYIVGNKKKDNILQGRQEIKNDAIQEDHTIKWNKIHLISHEKIEACRDIKLYDTPVIIVKETISNKKFLFAYTDKDVVFCNNFFGIKAPQKYFAILKKIYENMDNYDREFIFHIIATSGKLGVYKATAFLKTDFSMLPYPNNIEKIKLSETEQYFADDVIKYMLDWINGIKNPKILENVTDNQIEEYKTIYCKLLNAIYADYKPLETIKTGQFIITPFCYGEKPNSNLIFGNIAQEDMITLINNRYHENINIKRVIKIYDKNIIYIIKPKQYRFWLKSIAIRDADETTADIVTMRYN
ncbi:MAG: SAM-dependent methyltransferase [Campylobacteraceae bacterium]|nr:SAM-dependent methyltransferase [Campylobacteraceae bacterium]